MVVMSPAVVVTPAMMVMAVTPAPGPVMVMMVPPAMVTMAPAVVMVMMMPPAMVVVPVAPILHVLQQSRLVLADEIGARRQGGGLSRAGKHGGQAEYAQPPKNSHSHGSISWITNLRSSGKT